MEITCGIFIINAKKEILLGKPFRTNNGLTIPKGRIEMGETFLQAAKRETFEEFNVDFFNYDDSFFIELEKQVYKNHKKTLRSFVIFNEDSESETYKNLKCNSFFEETKPEIIDYQWTCFREAFSILPKTQRSALEEIKKLINDYSYPFNYNLFLENKNVAGFERFFEK